jgi:tetratricopeptide (TPR) repeat protein
MRYVKFGCLSLILLASAANAEWLEASGDHFVIYSDQDERVVTRFAERLERFHGAMAYVFAKPQMKPGPSNRVTVFVVSSKSKVREVTGAKNRFTVGMYIPRAGSSVAVIPKLKNASSHEVSGATILHHEYAHHFMIASLTARAYPRWFTEGFAEFFAGVRFKEDGSVLLGAPATYRNAELVYAPEVPIRKFLDFDGGSDEKKFTYDSFYGQSWILFHYLQMAPERKGQLSEYQRELASGRSALQAAETVFGDLGRLEDDLDIYMKRRRLSAMVVDGAALTITPIAVRKLRPGEAAMMPVMIESKVGVSPEEALELVPEAREVGARYRHDPAVLSALAEAEFDAGNDDAAIAAADAALAIDPNNINAHIQKGYALAHKVESGALPKESWRDVRSQFIKANNVENDHPVPLVQFYLTYLKQGEHPTKNAIDGLEWAMQLAPFDASLRWLAAQQMVTDERYADAAQTLAPLAYSPHPGEHTEDARKLLQDVETRLAQGHGSPPGPSESE